MDEATLLYENGEYEVALKAFSALIAQNATAEAHYYSGLCLFHLKKFKPEATDAFEAAIKIKPEESLYKHWKGVAYFEIYEFDSALRYLSAAIELNPNFADSYFYKGYCFYSLRKFAISVEFVNKALEIQADSKYYYVKGQAQNEIRQHKQALENFIKSIELDPNFAPAYLEKGVAHQKLKQTQEAIESYLQGRKLDVNNNLSYYYEGTLLSETGDYNAAIERFDKSFELNSNHIKSLVGKAHAYHKLQRFDEALAAYDTALEDHPEEQESIHKQKSHLLIDMKEFSKASEEFNKAITAKHAYQVEYHYKKNGLLKMGKTREAKNLETIYFPKPGEKDENIIISSDNILPTPIVPSVAPKIVPLLVPQYDPLFSLFHEVSVIYDNTIINKDYKDIIKKIQEIIINDRRLVNMKYNGLSIFEFTLETFLASPQQDLLLADYTFQLLEVFLQQGSYFFNNNTLHYASCPVIERFDQSLYIRDKEKGNTKLMQLIQEIKPVDEILELLKQKIYINAQNNEGESAVHLLVKIIPPLFLNSPPSDFQYHKNPETLKYFVTILEALIEAKIDLNLVTNENKTAFQLLYLVDRNERNSKLKNQIAIILLKKRGRMSKSLFKNYLQQIYDFYVGDHESFKNDTALVDRVCLAVTNSSSGFITKEDIWVYIAHLHSIKGKFELGGNKKIKGLKTGFEIFTAVQALTLRVRTLIEMIIHIHFDHFTVARVPNHHLISQLCATYYPNVEPKDKKKCGTEELLIEEALVSVNALHIAIESDLVNSSPLTYNEPFYNAMVGNVLSQIDTLIKNKIDGELIHIPSGYIATADGKQYGHCIYFNIQYVNRDGKEKIFFRIDNAGDFETLANYPEIKINYVAGTNNAKLYSYIYSIDVDNVHSHQIKRLTKTLILRVVAGKYLTESLVIPSLYLNEELKTLETFNLIQEESTLIKILPSKSKQSVANCTVANWNIGLQIRWQSVIDGKLNHELYRWLRTNEMKFIYTKYVKNRAYASSNSKGAYGQGGNDGFFSKHQNDFINLDNNENEDQAVNQEEMGELNDFLDEAIAKPSPFYHPDKYNDVAIEKKKYDEKIKILPKEKPSRILINSLLNGEVDKVLAILDNSQDMIYCKSVKGYNLLHIAVITFDDKFFELHKQNEKLLSDVQKLIKRLADNTTLRYEKTTGKKYQDTPLTLALKFRNIYFIEIFEEKIVEEIKNEVAENAKNNVLNTFTLTEKLKEKMQDAYPLYQTVSGYSPKINLTSITDGCTHLPSSDPSASTPPNDDLLPPSPSPADEIIVNIDSNENNEKNKNGNNNDKNKENDNANKEIEEGKGIPQSVGKKDIKIDLVNKKKKEELSPEEIGDEIRNDWKELLIKQQKNEINKRFKAAREFIGKKVGEAIYNSGEYKSNRSLFETILIESNTTLKMLDNQKNTVLQIAIQIDANPDIIEFLLNNEYFSFDLHHHRNIHNHSIGQDLDRFVLSYQKRLKVRSLLDGYHSLSMLIDQENMDKHLIGFIKENKVPEYDQYHLIYLNNVKRFQDFVKYITDMHNNDKGPLEVESYVRILSESPSYAKLFLQYSLDHIRNQHKHILHLTPSVNNSPVQPDKAVAKKNG